jgi:molybdate transport system substrate-binding protein
MKKLIAIALLFATTSLHAAEIHVYAAASLTDALRELAESYEQDSGDTLVFNFGASSTLARQIEEGAPADLFLSADEAKMDALESNGRIDADSRASVLSNTLVVVVPRDAKARISSPAQLVNVESLALAEPSSVPAGIYAKKYLQNVGVWGRVESKVVPTENVRAALAAVESGNVDAAMVYRTDARASSKVRIAYEVPAAQTPRISYPFAVVKDAANAEAAAKLLAHLRSREGRAIFAKHGFVVR